MKRNTKITYCLALVWSLICWGCNRQPPVPPAESELVAAVLARRPDQVDSLLQAGAAADSRDEEGTPALILAVNRGQDLIARRLVEAGADINARRQAYFHSTALMEAGVRNNPELAAWLLEHGADLHLRDTLGDTPLNWAAFYGHVELVALYLERGAGWSVAGRQGTALDIALHRGHSALEQFFIDRGAGEKLSPEQAAFFNAIRSGDFDSVVQALRRGMPVDQIDQLGTPALVLAAGLGREQMVDYLLRKGAAVNAMNRVGETALARAARFGHHRVVNRLLSGGADPALAGQPYRITPLIAAAQSGHLAILQELLASGVDLNVQEGINGFTPLMLATAAGHREVVKVLLAAGASPYIKSFEGAGLYDMLRYSNDPEMAALIRDYLLE